MQHTELILLGTSAKIKELKGECAKALNKTLDTLADTSSGASYLKVQLTVLTSLTEQITALEAIRDELLLHDKVV